jgi:hypothetical protein
MLIYESGGIIDFVMDKDIEILLRGVLGDISVGELFRHGEGVWCDLLGGRDR